MKKKFFAVLFVVIVAFGFGADAATPDYCVYEPITPRGPKEPYVQPQ
jgi:hypothetical protein